MVLALSSKDNRIDFQAFAKHEFESFNDYPKQAVASAKNGIKRNKALGNKCGTLVGKQRAQQLANGENLTIDTIKRMRSFLLRQKKNYDLAVRRKDYDACGYISYELWGGPSALPWAEKKLRQAGELEANDIDIIKDALFENSEEFYNHLFSLIIFTAKLSPTLPISTLFIQLTISGHQRLSEVFS